jgi:hypothetical protein
VTYNSPIASWPSSKLIEELRGVPHSCEYSMGANNKARAMVFFSHHRGGGVIGLIDYTVSPARAYRVLDDGQREEIL